MEVLEKGVYTGSILKEIRNEAMLASISSYTSNSFSDAWHCHVNAHISYVLRGGCSEIKKEQYERLPGKITFYREGEPHQIVRMRDSTHINLEMDESFFRQYEVSVQLFNTAVNSSPDAKFLMVKVYKELQSDDIYTATSIQMLLLGFLKQCSLNQITTVPDWIKMINDFLHENWQQKLSLADLSAVSGVHPVTISHYFPKYFSCTLGSYMRKLKIENSLTLIKENRKSLTEIGYDCGFFDQSHFIRTFKEMTGFLPTQYQRL